MKKPGKKRVMISALILLSLLLAGTVVYFHTRSHNKRVFFQICYYKLRFMLPFKKAAKTDNIYTAIENRDYESLEALLSRENNILNITDKRIGDVTRLAIEMGDTQSLVMFMAAGEKPEALLLDAIKLDKIDVVDFLTDCGAKINYRDSSQDTPLHIAAKYGKKEIAGFLVKKGADLRARNNSGETPLHNAINQGNRISLKDFSSAGKRAGPQIERDAFFQIAAMLMNNGADVNAKDDNGKAPIHVASYNGPFSSFIYGLYGNETDCIRSFNALMKENRKIVKLLVNRGADFEDKDSWGMTPLILAIRSGNKELVDFLLSRNAVLYNHLVTDGINIHDYFGTNVSALSCASFTGLYEVVEKFLKDKSLVSHKDPENGWTPLHYASLLINTEFYDMKMIKQQKVKIAGLLVSNGIDVNAKGKDGKTALHIASDSSFIEMMELLVLNGANINDTDFEGKTPLDLAPAGDRDNIERLIRKWRAKKGSSGKNEISVKP